MRHYTFAVLLDDNTWDLASVTAESYDEARAKAVASADKPVAHVIIVGEKVMFPPGVVLRGENAHRPALVFTSDVSTKPCVVFQKSVSMTANIAVIQDAAGTLIGWIDSDGVPHGSLREVTVKRPGDA